MSDIKTKIQKLAGTFGLDLVQKVTCSVDSVSVSDRSCMVTAINSNITSFQAQLMAEIDDGILVLPSVGSTVKVLYSVLNAPTVIQFSEIDSIYYVAGGSTFLINATGTQLMGSKYGGIPKIIDPDNSNAGVLARLNKIEDAFNSFSEKWNAFCDAYVPGSPSTAGLPATLETSTIDTLTPTEQSDIENTNVQHGDNS